MRAVTRSRYGSPDVLAVEEADRPQPGHDEVTVEVVAASLNTADLEHLSGSPPAARLWTGLRRPRNRRVGLDVAGRVVAVGPEVARLRPGDEVWADLFEFGHGAFADYVCAPEHAFSLKPAGVSFEAAAAVPHSGLLALQALQSRGPIGPGDQVLVNGAGGCVGLFAVQIAKAMGAAVTGVDHTDKLDLVAAAGADRVVDYTREDVSRHRQRYDLVVDIASTRSPLRFRRALKPDGRYVLIARNLAGFVEAAILGGLSSMMGRRRMGIYQWVPNRRSDLETVGALISKGEVTPIIDRRYPLEETQDAFLRLSQGHARGKIVVLPDPRRLR